MRLRIATSLSILVLLCVSIYAQKPFREYPGVEYENFPLPPDYQERT